MFFSKTVKRSKIIMLGDAGVGKTSLVHRWATRSFDRITFSTINETVVSRIRSEGDYEIQIDVWDTYGREGFQGIPASYFKNAKVAILCFDVVDSVSFHHLHGWAEELTRHEPDCKVCVCATKADLLTQDGVLPGISPEDIRTFTQNCSGDVRIYYTSSKNGTGTEEVFNKIFQYLKSIYNDLDTTTVKKHALTEKRSLETPRPQSRRTFLCFPCYSD